MEMAAIPPRQRYRFKKKRVYKEPESLKKTMEKIKLKSICFIISAQARFCLTLSHSIYCETLFLGSVVPKFGMARELISWFFLMIKASFKTEKPANQIRAIFGPERYNRLQKHLIIQKEHERILKVGPRRLL